MNALIIEPDVVLAKTYQKIFQEDGINTELCHDAASAIANVDKIKPSFILLELQLATHSGIELLHEIRSYQDLADIPIYVYSVISEDRLRGSRHSLRSLNVRRVCHKSKVDIKQLVGIIKSDLSQEDL